MRFYNREKELQNLRDIQISSLDSSKMTVIVGRRRIGKTKLIKEAYKGKVYFLYQKKMRLYFVLSLLILFKVL